MRKSNRAITDFEEIRALIDKCDTIRLGFADGQEAYILPLSFGYEAENGEFTFYVHGAKAGRRHELAAKNSRVCVEADMCLRFVDQTADYKSFIGSITEADGYELRFRIVELWGELMELLNK